MDQLIILKIYLIIKLKLNIINHIINNNFQNPHYLYRKVNYISTQDMNLHPNDQDFKIEINGIYNRSVTSISNIQGFYSKDVTWRNDVVDSIPNTVTRNNQSTI